MPDKFHRQPRVGVAFQLERKNYRKRVEISRDGEAPPGARCPNLRADVVKHLDFSTALHTQAALAQRASQPDVETAVVDGTNRARPMPVDPAHRLVEKRAEKRIIFFQHFDGADHRRRREVVQQLRARSREPRAANRADFQAWLLRQQLTHHSRRVLVARVLAGDDEQIHAAVARRRQVKRQFFQFGHRIIISSRRGFAP
jgi:hypothetical protein